MWHSVLFCSYPDILASFPSKCRHSCRLGARNPQPGSNHADSCTPKCSQNRADPSRPRPHGARSPAACMRGLQGRREEIGAAELKIKKTRWTVMCQSSVCCPYVCTRVGFHSTSGRADRFWTRSPGSDVLAGTGRIPRCPPMERDGRKNMKKENKTNTTNVTNTKHNLETNYFEKWIFYWWLKLIKKSTLNTAIINDVRQRKCISFGKKVK